MSQQVGFFYVLTYARTNNLDFRKVLSYVIQNEVLRDARQLLLYEFRDYSQSRVRLSKSQLLQDLFAGFLMSGAADHTYLEFGATDGLSLSNTYFLEHELGWDGALAEPSPQWHEALYRNRGDARILTECIWKNSGQTVQFFVSDIGELSTMSEYRQSDANSMPGNAHLRNQAGETVDVKTISLNDVIGRYFEGVAPSYVSIDTEVSEFEIVSHLDLSNYRPAVFTIEHNFTEAQQDIDQLLSANGYVRVFRDLTAFDAWYVASEILEARQVPQFTA